MHTATLAAPVSNRTRRQMQAADKTPGRSYGWLSAVIVAGLMISMIGSSWLNREPGNPHDNLAFAPGTAETIVDDGTPWTQPVSFKECPEDAERHVYDPENPGDTMYSQEDYDQVSSERSYEIVGSAAPEDADAVVTRMRETQACIYEGKSTLTWTARFEYENRTTAGRESVDATADKRAEGSESVSDWLKTELGLTYQDLIVYQDPDELTLDGTESVVNSTLFNPDMVVEFADGRIGIAPNIVTYEPISQQWDVDSVEGTKVYVTIFVYQDGEWMLDENLPVCIGDCSDLPEGTPMSGFDPYATPIATPQP